ncbi:GTP-binding protein HflX [Aequorivita sublithincola DSM 14238]|uniref:GTPase HflX n=1 Tax=Aequorivita sublithincola (strain DSM 14238 / LMG 21431 / ACAM 643 / 9-3) TaxID=746697 RepID=I3YVH7_AEQSU|nr:GTPase HflX [Aequorivita sublithincola]AFL80995.1 GTP-binding protein HflX [Aequorivita sublithincola DSM 14238]
MIEKTDISYEKTVLIGLITQYQDEVKAEEYLDELEFLAYTAGGEVLKRFVQKMEKPNPKTFIGTGKLQDVKNFVEENDVGVVIFDDELSPAQQKNIQKELDCKVLDRTNLILDIFAQRAQTSNASTQVELAQYQYLLPRLAGMWTHLERQRGGIGMRGPGETEIETDRRIVRDRIALLKDKLKKIDRQMGVQRGNRGALVRVALVGYTNVGKSTLMNVISKSDVFAENKLFATLDTTVRKVVIGNLPFLLTDTVGFIRKLPTQLVESFKSTLDEVREADLLLHVVDISHPSFEHHIDSVDKILEEIGSADKPTIMVFNKIDAYEAEEIEEDDLMTEKTKAHYTLEEWKQTWMAKLNGDAIFISALNKENFSEFRKLVYEKVKEIHTTRFPYNSFLYEDYVEEED